MCVSMYEAFSILKGTREVLMKLQDTYGVLTSQALSFIGLFYIIFPTLNSYLRTVDRL